MRDEGQAVSPVPLEANEKRELISPQDAAQTEIGSAPVPTAMQETVVENGVVKVETHGSNTRPEPTRFVTAAEEH